jgi:hypothetical protein
MSFLFRGLAAFAFINIKEPNNGYAFGIAVLLIMGTNIETIVVSSVFKKIVPGDLRGSFNGLLNSVV